LSPPLPVLTLCAVKPSETMSRETAQVGLQLKVGVRARDPAELPFEDDALGESLTRMVQRSVQRGLPPPAILVLRQEQVEIIDLRPILDAGLSVHRFIAAAAGQEGVSSVALLAVLDLEERGRPLGHAATAFIEWPDNRWWHGYFLLSPSFRPLEDLPLVTRRAIEGQPRPKGFGGWFSRARFQRLSLHLERATPPTAPAGEPASEPLVH
jgi:hypothetical protein